MIQTAVKTDTSVIIRRTLPYTQEQLWYAWTEPAALKQWFHPGPDLKTPIAEVDLRVNGSYHLQIHDSHVYGEYQEVDPPNKLVFTWYWQDHEELTTLITVEFVPVDSAETEIILTHERFQSAEERDNHEWGWYGCIAELERYLEASS